MNKLAVGKPIFLPILSPLTITPIVLHFDGSVIPASASDLRYASNASSSCGTFNAVCIATPKPPKLKYFVRAPSHLLKNPFDAFFCSASILSKRAFNSASPQPSIFEGTA